MRGAVRTDKQRHRQQFLRLLLSALLFPLLIACTSDPQPPLRLGTNVWPGYEPLYLARDLGYFDDHRITLVEYPSASEVMRAFRNRSLEVAALTLDEALLLREAEIPIKVFLVTDVSHGADVILARRGIDSVVALRGRRIGVETTALGALMLTRALALHGMTVDDVEVVDLQVSEHETAFLEERVDAVVTFDPVRSRLIDSANAVEVFSSREIPNEVVDVLVIHAAALERTPATVQALVDGWFRALDHMQTSPQSAAQLMAARLKLSPEAVLASYRDLVLPDRRHNRSMLDAEDGTLYATAERLESVLLDWQLLKGHVDTDDLLTHRFVD